MPALLVKACLNGTRTRAEHPAVPLMPAELAAAARGAVAAGAGALHFHPRAADGTQSLDAADCDPAVAAVREACPGIPLGLSTGAFIEPDSARRAALVASWRGRRISRRSTSRSRARSSCSGRSPSWGSALRPASPRWRTRGR